MSSSRLTLPSLGSPRAAQPDASTGRGPRPAAAIPAGAQPDAIAAFLNYLLEQYEQTASSFQPRSGSTSPL